MARSTSLCLASAQRVKIGAETARTRARRTIFYAIQRRADQ
jgi:hypothetical protein